MIAPIDLPPVSQPLPWHEQEWEHLAAQMVCDRLPHALLMVGRQYIGKTQLALALSRLLLCAQPDGLLNCGRCHACELNARGNHGDFLWVEPIENSRVIRIDQIRNVVRFTSTKAAFGSRKVIVIAPAERMNVNSFNALLKPLEEPSNDTYLILICNQLQSIPATIRSRCQILRLTTPAREACLRWLDKFTADPKQSRSLLAIAGGLPVLAHQLYLSDGTEGYMAKRLALESLAYLRISVPEVAQLWSNDEIGSFLQFLASRLQFIISTLSAEQLKMQQSHGLFELLGEVYQLQQSIISGANPNKQLLLLGLLSKYLRQLGTGVLGDNILSHNGGAGI